MSKTDIENLWDAIHKGHERIVGWLGVGMLIVLVGVPVSVIFLPASMAAFVATLLAFAGMMVSGVSMLAERDYEDCYAELQQLPATAEVADQTDAGQELPQVER